MNIGMLAGQTPDPSQGTFRMIPDRMTFDDRLDPGDMRVWACLAFMARFPTRATLVATDQAIAAKLRTSPQTLRRSLQRLDQAGYITRTREGQTRLLTLNPGGDGTLVAEFSLRVAAG